ncbi:hypothetical protein GCM10018781_80820 [Kitasatospora indigofera]|uniref:Uncharacterized protein n=1 Tax=Kitasatospora indigofera TaxID=67307 RepID=A0A919D945_9ACTN|nr:hypothetical protein [Kitasatospora indigofera]GHE28548.1 hypothetical protein GCM10018781_80820 [Kitasatospora indigofera]
MFKRNDTVRIAQNLFHEEGSRSFVGETGTVNTAKPDGVTIAGLDGPDSTQTYWFSSDEVEKA